MPHFLLFSKPELTGYFTGKRFMRIVAGLIAAAAIHIMAPHAGLYAQSLESMMQNLTPDQRQTLENLSPDERQALQAEVMKSGGAPTPELIERLKALQQAKEAQKQAAPKPAATETPREAAEARAAAKTEEKKFEEKTDKDVVVEDKLQKRVVELRRFGLDFFESARKRVLVLEESISKGTIPQALHKDALAGFVGPLEMVASSVNASVPPQYVLNPGDTVMVYYWGDLIELTTLTVTLNERGEASIPKVGKFVARGMSLPQFQAAVQNQLQRVFGKGIKLIATMDSLKSIQILITGEAFRPGAYAVSAVTTLFNALYASGGPNEHGSLRDIKLIRDKKTITMDFYDYLMNGDGRYDVALQAGDTIVFSRVGKLASIAGEVNRPGLFELKKDETLRNLVKMANGIKPTGLTNKVHIQSIVPHRQRAVVDVDLSRNVPAADHEIFDGDSVTVEAIIHEIKNVVTLTGSVKVPGNYELKKNMSVADLFNEVNEPWGETYLERADIIRRDEDRKTTTLIPINLGKALKGDPEHNIALARFDRIVVYSKWDVKFYPDRRVIALGAVQKPGEYERSEGMTIKDLLLKAGNILPNTHMQRADLTRYVFEKDAWLTIPVDLNKLLAGDEHENILLSDRDTLRVYSLREASYIPPHIVEIQGNVQRPGSYPRSEGMRLKDLLAAAGGVRPGSGNELVISKARDYFGTAKAVRVKLDLLEKGDESQNVLLGDEDIVMVRTDSAFFDRPIWVEIAGEVKFPGRYPLLRKDSRLSELIDLAGGLTHVANPKGAVFMRKTEHLPSPEQKSDMLFIDRIINVLNESDARRLSARNLLLIQRGLGGVEATGQGPAVGAGTVVATGTSAKDAAALSLAPSIAQATGALTGGIVSAFTPAGAMTTQARTLDGEQLTQSARIIIDLKKALNGGDNPENTVLRSGDSITIPQKADTVSVMGAVMNPVTVQLGKKRKVKNIITLAGGYASDADEDRVLVLRVDGTVIPADDAGKIEEGDIIYVPTRVVETEIITTADKIINVIKYTLTTAAGVIIFLALIP